MIRGIRIWRALAVTVVTWALLPASTALADGACCLSDGGCTNLSEADCLAAGGGFIGEGSTCTSTDCENTTGGCCFPPELGGNCLSLSFPDCSAQGGVAWMPFVDCQNACPGACCFNDGSGCNDLGQVDCEDFGGFFQGNGSNCSNVNCEPFGACCFADGTCEISFESDCFGTYLGAGTDCTACPDPTGACCFQSGFCLIATETDCVGMGGTYTTNGSDCTINPCPQPPATGACCLADGTCAADETEADCNGLGGTWQGEGIACANAACPQPPTPGACCFGDGSCADGLFVDGCAAAGGYFQGEGSDCGSITCAEIPARPSGTEKGSFLAFSRVEAGWADDAPEEDSDGSLVRDTIIQISNDSANDVRVLMYFVNGDEPLPFEGTERPHAGWNYIDVEITLTGNQTVWWSAATGQGSIDVPGFWTLDPGIPMGRPLPCDPFSSGFESRGVRGFIYAWAVDSDDLEIRHNHLSGGATIIEYPTASAAQYNAVAHQRLTSEPGDSELRLDGVEYAQSYSALHLEFAAIGGDLVSAGSMPVYTDTEVTLQPVTADFRPDEPVLPVTTKADYSVWNENEIKLSGAYRCITCWDATFLSDYGVPNHFRLDTLQTDRGRARIRGIESALCNEGLIVSEDEPLLGVVLRRLVIDPVNNDDIGRELTSTNLVGMGADPTAVIRYVPVGVPPEAPASKGRPVNRGKTAMTGR